MITKEKSKSQEVAIVEHQGTPVRITWHDVKTLVCPLATDQETAIFLKTCQALQLSPFHNEIYLIKYNERDKAATVVAIGAYLKAAEVNDNYNGCAAGIILRDSGGKLEFREGAFLLEDEMDKLVGGWARVYRKDRDRDTYMAVNKAECVRYTREGKLTQFWAKEKQASMLRKTALKRALVEAFASLFAGTLATTEVADEVEYHEIPEGQLPPGFQKNGKTDWRKLYGKLRSELGITPEQAHELIGAESFNDLLADGWTEERIFDAIAAAHQQQKATEKEPEQVVDVQTGEIISQDEVLFGEREEKAGDAVPEEAQGEEPTGTAAPAKPKRDPETIKTINDLLKACNQDFKLQPKDVYAELNVKSANEITNPSDCYIRIASVRSQDG